MSRSMLGKLSFAAVLLLTLLAAGGAEAGDGRPIVLVLTLKGFRWDYLDRGLTPTLNMLAAQGVRAKALKPSFPSYSRPDYFTLMTGLRPDENGIIDNTMVDPQLPGKQFGPRNRDASDPVWWTDAEPLWATAEKAGLRTASSLYPAANIPNRGVLPSYSGPDERNAPVQDQIDYVTRWLSLSSDVRPSLVLMDFQKVDLVGHAFGPDSPEENAAISEIDGDVAKLLASIKATPGGQAVNLLILSDQGMAVISEKQTIYLDDLMDLSQADVIAFGSLAGINPHPGHEAAAAGALLKPHDHFQCWRKQDVPAHLHYGTHRRVPQIVCLADVGWQIGPKASIAPFLGQMLGNHGYDPEKPDMWGIFIAQGPAFARGSKLPVFDNIDVYPLLAHLLGLAPKPNDGNLGTFKPALAGEGAQAPH